MRLRSLVLMASGTVAILCLSAAASAEPTNRWWSGAGMGYIEYGYSASDGSKIYIACDAERTQHSLRVAIRGVDPRPRSEIVFYIDGEEVRFWTTQAGDVEMNSHASLSSLYYLFDRLREGRRLILRFDGILREFPLAGSAKSLGPELCPP